MTTALQGIPVLGAWNTVGTVFSGSTATTQLIPPYPGPAGTPPYLYNSLASYSPLVAGAPLQTKSNWLTSPSFGITRITSIWSQTSSTAHQTLIFRPLNFTYFPAGLAKNTTAIPNGSGASSTGLFDDPGVYSTNYKYPTAGGVFPAQVADAAISGTNLNVCYQLSDGTWQFDTIASGTFNSSLTLTTGTPNRAGGVILAGAPLFYFGAISGALLDPATGQAAIQLNIKASTQNVIQDNLVGAISMLHQGDPALLYDPNGTAADFIMAAGYYAAY
jgi:hypothetical protein